MDFRYLTAFVLVCLAAAGCRRDAYMDAYLEMLNAEKRALEDRVYELEYDYERALEELEEYRASQKSGVGERHSDLDEPMDDFDFSPNIEMPPDPEDGTGESAAPAVPESAATGTRTQQSVGISGRHVAYHDLSEPMVADADERVEVIYINPRLTGGEDFDRQLGDDGLTVMIEPRNKDKIFVPKAAEVTIVLLDPAKDGEAARYASWVFDKDVAGEVLRSESLDRGLFFRIPWSGAPPDNERLHLFVRYHTDDGRKLEADRLITIRPPGRVAHGWTPRTSDSQGTGATR